MSNNEEEFVDADALTKEEESKCWEAFSAFDKDSSGFIDANELRIVLEMMGQKTTEEEIFRMIAEADAENTGKITYSQFKRVIADQKKNQSLSNEEYLMKTVLPVLYQGMKIVDQQRPVAPLEYLALYLLKHQDQIKMPSPPE